MLRLWKISSVLLFVLNLSWASTYIYFPVSGEVSDGGTFYIGKTGPGHLLRLIVDATLPSPVLSLTTDPPAEVTVRDGRAWIDFEVPSSPGRYFLKVTVERNDGVESFNVAYDVQEGLLSLKGPRVIEVPETGSSSFNIAVVNRGVAETRVEATCGFCNSVKRVVPPKEAVTIPLVASAYLSGTYSDKVVLRDLRSGEVHGVPLQVVVKPTMEGRVKTVYGFPDLFIPVMTPFRLLLGVIFWRT